LSAVAKTSELAAVAPAMRRWLRRTRCCAPKAALSCLTRAVVSIPKDQRPPSLMPDERVFPGFAYATERTGHHARWVDHTE
jgi:hypothetical protein